MMFLCSLLLSTVSGEGAKERSDRALLSPWVKFLWESYRNMLELLKNNNTVQTVYASVAKEAFKFCLNFQRRTEFRKLCDTVSVFCSCTVYYNSACHMSVVANDVKFVRRTDDRSD